MIVKAYVDHGSIAQRAGIYQLAKERYVAALRLNADCDEALNNLSPLLADQKHLMAAVACIRKALAINPINPGYLSNLGNILLRMEHYDAAIEVLQRAIELDPNECGHYHNLGLAYYATNPQRAIEEFDNGLKLQPNDPRIVRDRGLACLALGKWFEGFTAVNTRYDASKHNLVFCSGIEEWQNQDLTDKILLVHHEQGFGDTLQFCRFLKALKVKQIILAVPYPLLQIMRNSKICDQVVDLYEPAPYADYHCALMDVPRRIDLATELQKEWYSYLEAPLYGPKLRAPGAIMTVGICWSGSSGYSSNMLRSMPFENFLSIADIPGVQIVSLQFGEASDDITKYGGEALIPKLPADVRDFSDMAAVVKQLDLIISIDTAVLHLAGGMGKECLALLPYARCWRWGRNRDDSPFYPSLKIIQQEYPKDWIGVMVRVREYIAEKLERLSN